MARILVIDDERDVTTSLKRGLELHGFKVDTFNDPLEALSKFKPDSYDLLLIDIRMPKMNGFELYREIRKKGDNSTMCFITAFEVYQNEFERIFPKLDVRYFIKKPIKISDLVARINEILNAKISKL